MLKSLPNGDFDRRTISVFSLQLEWFGQRGCQVRHGAPCRATMHLRSVDKEGMAQVDHPCITRRQRYRSVGADLIEHHVRSAGFARRLEKPRQVLVRPSTCARRFEERYLAYALSTIMGRALPDVRDAASSTACTGAR